MVWWWKDSVVILYIQEVATLWDEDKELKKKRKQCSGGKRTLQNSEYIISTTTSATERARETKKKDKYVKQLNELRPYYQALSHIALQRIQMDLDDGVKKNYQLFQSVEISTEGKKKQTIDLLAKL